MTIPNRLDVATVAREVARTSRNELLRRGPRRRGAAHETRANRCRLPRRELLTSATRFASDAFLSHDLASGRINQLSDDGDGRFRFSAA